MQIVKIVRNFVETLISDPGEIDIDAHLEDTIAFLTGQPQPLEITEDEKEPIALEKAPLELQSKLKSHLPKLKDAKTKQGFW